MFSTDAQDTVYVESTLSRLRKFGSYIKEEAAKQGFHGFLSESVRHAEPTYVIQIRGPKCGVQRSLSLKWLLFNNISDDQLKAMCQDDIEHLKELEGKEAKLDGREYESLKPVQ